MGTHNMFVCLSVFMVRRVMDREVEWGKGWPRNRCQHNPLYIIPAAHAYGLPPYSFSSYRGECLCNDSLVEVNIIIDASFAYIHSRVDKLQISTYGKFWMLIVMYCSTL